MLQLQCGTAPVSKAFHQSTLLLFTKYSNDTVKPAEWDAEL